MELLCIDKRDSCSIRPLGIPDSPYEYQEVIFLASWEDSLLLHAIAIPLHGPKSKPKRQNRHSRPNKLVEW